MCVLLRENSDSGCCAARAISYPSTGSVMDLVILLGVSCTVVASPQNPSPLISHKTSRFGSFAPRTSGHERPRSVLTPIKEVRVLRRAEEDPGTSVQRTAAAEVSACHLSGEFSIHNHIQRVQAQSFWPTCKGDVLPVASRKMCCSPAVCSKHALCDGVGFTRARVKTPTSTFRQCLGGHRRSPRRTSCLTQQTDCARRFCVVIYEGCWEMYLFIKDNTRGPCIMGTASFSLHCQATLG